MARKSKSRSTSSSSDSAQAIRDSAQKIWLAGLGAFDRARTEGPRLFETLVEQGRAMGARAVGAADEALRTMREAGAPGGRWDKLEQVFEERVSRSLAKLGVVTARDLEELSRQVKDLQERIGAAGKASRTGGRRKAAAKGGARKRKAKRATPPA